METVEIVGGSATEVSHILAQTGLNHATLKVSPDERSSANDSDGGGASTVWVQPSPTGDDEDPALALPKAQPPRMIAGSAQKGFGEKIGIPDPREERE